MIQSTYQSRLKVITLTASILVGAVVAFFLRNGCSRADFHVKNFNAARDTEFILDMFNKNWYWLVENPDFEAEFILEHMSPTKRPEDFGKEIIKLGYLKNQPVGFTTYHMKNFYEGYIHFLLVDESVRGQRIGQQLMNYAIKDLKHLGATLIRLNTRTSNKAAQKLYERMGFRLYKKDDAMVYYELRV